MDFRHEVIDDSPPCGKLGFCMTTDLTGNGRDDVIVGGAGVGFPGKRFIDRAAEQHLPTFRSLRKRLGLAETNVFWYENPGFRRHDVAVAPYLDVGATLGDISGDGRPNLVAGQGIGHQELYWFEVPRDPRQLWVPHVITDRFEKYHDLSVADIDDDGEPEVVGISQESETIFYFDIPDDPIQSPWPSEYLHIVAEDRLAEGLVVVDLDGDGNTELVAGTHVYRPDTSSRTGWVSEEIAPDWDLTRVATADLTGNGTMDIVLSEGDSPEYGTGPGRVAFFEPPDWEPTVLKDNLFCPHSLQIADFTGNGDHDIYVAEMGLGKHETPHHFLFVNTGQGEFEERVIASGVATHEAKVTDLNGNGRPDVVGKSYTPDHHVDAWINDG